jgi:hypothetical protein
MNETIVDEFCILNCCQPPEEISIGVAGFKSRGGSNDG